MANTPLDGAAIWLAAGPELDGTTGKFFSKRREIDCKFRDAQQIEALHRLVDQQLRACLTPA